MMRESSSLLSLSQPDSLVELTDEQRLRLTDLLDRYLSALEQGRPIDQDELLQQHPDLAPALGNYFQSLEDLHDMAAGFAGNSPSEAEDDPGEVRRLGDYELLGELGRGGMGVVYEARQISLDRRVALKILPFAAVLDQRQIARFQHEAQAAAQLHHPHIVPVFAIGVERGVHYYAMQLVNGQSLEQLIQSRREERTQRKRVRRGSEEFQTIARLGQQAADALQAAHDYGIVHRDIKPSNLLLDAAGKLWVTDFGLARMQRDVSLTRSGDLVGTLRYMSPEQASGSAGVVDERTDIYSLGATLYELATLRPAYGEENSAALLKAIETREPLSPRKVRPEIPVDLENIIGRAMARERSERYLTAADLAADLQRFLAGEPTKARALTASERLTRWGQRRARSLVVAAGLLSLLVVGLSIATFLIARAQHESREQLARAQRYARESGEVLDYFGMQLSQRLANVTGAEQVRRDLLLEASDYYRRFIADSANDPTRRSELAVAYGRLAALLDEVGTAEEALAAHRRAVSYLSDLDSPQKLAIARNNFALALRRANDLPAARTELNSAIASQQALLANEPKNAGLANELATSHNSLGLVHMSADDADSAERSFEAAIVILQPVVERKPAAVSSARTLAAACCHLAGLRKNHHPAEARQLYEQAIQSLSEVESDRDVKQELATANHSYGTLLTRLQEYPAAIAAFNSAAELQQALIEQSPADANLRSNLGSTLSNRGVAQAASGDYTAASTSLAAATEQQQAALRLAPSSTRFRDLLNRHERLQATYAQHRSPSPELSNAATE